MESAWPQQPTTAESKEQAPSFEQRQLVERTQRDEVQIWLAIRPVRPYRSWKELKKGSLGTVL